MQTNFPIPAFCSKVKVFEDETYALLRMRLEEKVALDWPFEFWDNKAHCRIRQKMEALNDVVSDVYILPTEVEVDGQESCKHCRVDDDIVPNLA